MVGMGAKSITIVRAVTADFFFDCRAAEVPSDEWFRDVPWGVHNLAQDLRLESLKSSFYFDISPCRPLNVNRRFGKLCFSPSFTLISYSAYFRPWRCKRHVPPIRQLTVNGLHSIKSQKIELLKTIAVRTFIYTILILPSHLRLGLLSVISLWYIRIRGHAVL
jgi:hypothetical protein